MDFMSSRFPRRTFRELRIAATVPAIRQIVAFGREMMPAGHASSVFSWIPEGAEKFGVVCHSKSHFVPQRCGCRSSGDAPNTLAERPCLCEIVSAKVFF